jgi:hypothetical protein
VGRENVRVLFARERGREEKRSERKMREKTVKQGKGMPPATASNGKWCERGKGG